MDSAKKFNIRVYGIVINEANELLITHEERNGFHMTKLPGGGLEWGEGLKEGLIREFQEELNWLVEINELFYLTDYFQPSFLNSDDQVISVYYRVKFIEELDSRHIVNPDEIIKFQWIKMVDLDSSNFTFPIDRLVIDTLCKTKIC